MSVGIVRISAAGRALLQRALDCGGWLVLRALRDPVSAVDEAERLYDARVFVSKRFVKDARGRRWVYRLSPAGEIVAKTVCAP